VTVPEHLQLLPEQRQVLSIALRGGGGGDRGGLDLARELALGVADLAVQAVAGAPDLELQEDRRGPAPQGRDQGNDAEPAAASASDVRLPDQLEAVRAEQAVSEPDGRAVLHFGERHGTVTQVAEMDVSH